jgi:hypothetical protein
VLPGTDPVTAVNLWSEGDRNANVTFDVNGMLGKSLRGKLGVKERPAFEDVVVHIKNVFKVPLPLSLSLSLSLPPPICFPVSTNKQRLQAQRSG